MQPLRYYDENIPCLAACPVHTNAGAYVAAIADGDDEFAYLTARLPNPFASVCGRVCAAPCEKACRRGEIDQPIAIRALKRFVTEKYGVESGSDTWRTVAAPTGPDRTQSIGIIGGGPAGMSAAHDLRRHGYKVTVYEATGQLGGMMKLGIPEYRLDRTLLQAELDAIVSLGVEVKLNTRLGRDITFEEIRSRHDAVFVAIGASLGRGLDIEGHQADGVVKAIEFLINANQGFEVEVGARVIVIGGGDVAMDAARTALRREAYGVEGEDAETIQEERSSMVEALDVARTAGRAGAAHVTVISLESEEEMPASPFELEEAGAEQIEFIHRRGPSRILTENGKAVGLETVKVTSVFDENGRFSPTFDRSDVTSYEADTVILAIGQSIDVEALGASGPEISPRKTIAIKPDMTTSLDGVWAGGDAAHGPRTLIEAIADGRKAAADIHKKFTGETFDSIDGQLVELEQFHRLQDTYDRVERLPVPTLATDRRIGLLEVETGFTEQQARCEAARCLRCFANIELDVDKCVLCALCADVCPLDLISLVPAEEVHLGATGSTALLLDERACIRCGLCIERCPPKALSMAVWTGIGVPV
ncbi:MAG TPA: FAD-dependent oxidoreductase [Acidimicrobiia bacterium]|nr:FAD-dependent oxidoreductase [Acidimicrobiia bacterium]